MAASARPTPIDKLPRHIRIAVAKVREFWGMGAQSLRKHPEFPRGPNKLKSEEAKRLRVGLEKLRQARQFAKRCRKPELQARIDEAIQLGVPPNWIVLREVYTLKSPTAVRRIWLKALEDRLNHRQVITMIRGEHLRRGGRSTPGAGRKPKVDSDPDLAYARLLQASRQWLSIATKIEEIRIDRARRKRIGVARKSLEALFKT